MYLNQFQFTNHFIILAVFQTLLFTNCRRQSIQHFSTVETLAEKELGPGISSTTYNESNTYALCQQTHSQDHAKRTLKYIVVDVSEMKVIQHGSFQSGVVRWLTDTSIEIETSTGLLPTSTKQVIQIKKMDNN